MDDIDLQSLLNNALEEVRENSKHNLSPKTRVMILSNFSATSIYGPSKRLGWLGILTVQKVLPIWQENLNVWDGIEDEFGDINVKEVPFLLLKLLEDLVKGHISINDIILELDIYHDIISAIGDELLDYQEEGPKEIVGVSDAAYKAILLFIEGVNQNTFKGWEQHADDELPTEKLDVAGSAMLAYAGGNTFKKGDLNKRLEFWEWWLTEAIPQAWKLAQQSSKQ